MKKSRKGEIAHFVLGLVGVGGIVIAGALCPGLLMIVPRPMKKRSYGQKFAQAVYRLDKKGLLNLRQSAAGWKIQLTKRGREEFSLYELGQKQLTRPKKWDQKWRILIFDIPEKRKWLREKIRAMLRSFGFHRLQDSVWVFPFECKEVLELLRTRYKVRTEALYIRAEHVDHDSWLRKEFQLN